MPQNGYCRQRLVDSLQNRADRQLVKTAAVTFKMAFAAELLAWQAGQRVLHHPHIGAPLYRPGGMRGLDQSARRPRPDQPGAGRIVERNSRAAAGCGEMSHRGIGSDINRRALEECSQTWPVEPTANPRHCGLATTPEAINIGLLGGVLPLGRNETHTPLHHSAGYTPPAAIRPT